MKRFANFFSTTLILFSCSLFAQEAAKVASPSADEAKASPKPAPPAMKQNTIQAGTIAAITKIPFAENEESDAKAQEVLRGKSLIPYSRPIADEKIYLKSKKGESANNPKSFSHTWVGEPHVLDLERTSPRSYSKYTREYKHLGAENTFLIGESILTPAHARVEIKMEDATLLSLGKNTLLHLEKWSGSGLNRTAEFKIPHGWMHVTVRDPVQKTDQIIFDFPNAYVTLRGIKGVGESKTNEFYVHSSTDSEHSTTTELLNIQGQLSVEYMRLTPRSAAYSQTKVLNPGERFAVSGKYGLGDKVQKTFDGNLTLPQAISHFETLR